jgi:hypothetical protein
LTTPLCLTQFAPGSQWTLNGDSFSGLTWLDDSAAPTQEECDAAWPQIEYDRAHAAVEAERHAAYIADADPLFFGWQRGENTEQDWLDAVQAVKDAHPYPDPL